MKSNGHIVGLSYIIYGGFSILAGLLSDRIGPRYVLQFGILVLFAGIVGSIFTASIFSLYIWAIVTGIGQALTNVMLVPLLTENSSSNQRVKLFSIAFGIGNLFMFLGTFGAVALADFLKTSFTVPSTSSLRWVIFSAAIVIVQSKLLMEKISDKIRGFTNSIGFMSSMIGTGTAGLFSMRMVSNLGIYWGYIALFMLSAASISISVCIFIYSFQEKKGLETN